VGGPLAIRMDDGTAFVARPGWYHLTAERAWRLGCWQRAGRRCWLVRRIQLREI